MAYYQAIDCYSAPARSKYNESEYFVKVYWSVDGVNEMDMDEVEVYPNPASETVSHRHRLQRHCCLRQPLDT